MNIVRICGEAPTEVINSYRQADIATRYEEPSQFTERGSVELKRTFRKLQNSDLNENPEDETYHEDMESQLDKSDLFPKSLKNWIFDEDTSITNYLNNSVQMNDDGMLSFQGIDIS